MAWFGWTTTKQAATYTKKANRARMEGGAALRLVKHAEGDTENKKVQPF
jgi:hypothetical protein